MKVAYLDRDGTINKDYPDEDWRDKEVPEILPGCISGMKLLMQKGYRLIIVTNQYIIQEGIISLAQYELFQHRLCQTLAQEGVFIQDTFYCPHTDKENCSCKKPKTGLIDQSMLKYPQISLSDSILIGDAHTDRMLAERKGISFYGICGKDFPSGFEDILAVAKTL